jgi:hypothetical protein
LLVSSHENPSLTPAEVAKLFADPATAAKYGPSLTLEEASELLKIPVETLRGWRSRGLLDCCTRRRGKHLRFLRDKYIHWFFAGD